MLWFWIVLAMLAGGAIGYAIGWIVGDDHGRTVTNRQWLDPKNKDWKRMTVIKGDPHA